MKVFKFGGASVKNAGAIINVANIIRNDLKQNKSKLVVVISAMGSTTDQLEELVACVEEKAKREHCLQEIKAYHMSVVDELFPGTLTPVRSAVENMFRELERKLMRPLPGKAFYDQVVSQGEILSTLIVAYYLIEEGIIATWQDAREIIHTDAAFGEADILWKETGVNCALLHGKLREYDVVVTQGFIGKTPAGMTTTLGREGSDFTAAILAASLPAASVTLWKDVPGLMNADPKRIPHAQVLKELPYAEAAELMYYGANLIHLKTIRPLSARDIPLYVRSFISPALPGTKIFHNAVTALPPMFVFKDEQVLVSVRIPDLAFITEFHLQEVFALIHQAGVRINLVQHSAVSLSFCFDHDTDRFNTLVRLLAERFEVHYNAGLQLITIKNFTPEAAAPYKKAGNILIEQATRSTLQLLIKA